ncbi:metallophosphoesterase [Flavobacterium sp.]|uniref:metallophosphoesterase n=1 Tax=Flavobacterium sp. TaxID=239 RepID=UPI003F69AF19
MKKIILTIIITLLISALLIFFFFKNLTIVDENYNIIKGEKIMMNNFSNDGPYVFNVEDKKVAYISNSKSNKLIKEIINNNSISVLTQSNKVFQLRLKKEYPQESFSFNSNKIFSISDIEGNFEVFSKFLINNKIIDNKYNWIYGDGHLVLNGDFFDRGNDVTGCLWLIYKLEQEAEKNNGKVHFVIGNHEEMNLRGYVKYVHPKYIAMANELKIPYKDLLSEDSELGKWIRTKNSIIKINDILFTHGGLNPELVDDNYSIEEINQLTQKFIGKNKDYLNFINPRANLIFDRKGPMWYRGYFGDYKEYYKEIKENELDKILNFYQVKHIVVGHTIVDKVKTLFNNRIIAIDAMSEDDPRKNDDDNMAVSCEGLFIENNHFYRVLFNGKKELLFKK